jgi:hypothetical protein
MRIEGIVLKDEADPAFFGRNPRDVVAVEIDFSAACLM